MSFNPRVIRLFLIVLLTVAGARAGAAADPKASDRMKELISGAAATYTDGAFDKTRGQLVEAITLGRENGLGSSPLMAKSYVLMGVLLINEAKDTKNGIRYFAKALEISPAIQVPPSMVTKAVKAAFDKAEDQDAPVSDPELPDATAAAKPQKSAKDAKKEAAAAEAEERQSAQDAKKQAEVERKQAEVERKQAEAEERQRAKQDKTDRDRQDRDAAKLNEQLAQAKVGESQARAERERLVWEKGERDKQLTDAKGRIQQLERDYTERNKALTAATARAEKLEGEKGERDKQLADANKQLADAKGRIQQLERDYTERNKALAAATAKLEKLEAEKPERERQLTEAKGRVQQLEKDKAERDKWLASAKDTEKKTHEANEKLEHTLSEVAARDRERRTREESERREREKLAEGPELPGRIAEPIHCTLPDEVPPETDLFVHCVPQPGVNAKVIALHYRPSGVAVFNTIVLERSRKGWYVGTIPGGKVRGKLLQYYVEARDGKDSIAAANGKPGSPNVMTIKPKR